jgi:hypothetical protein
MIIARIMNQIFNTTMERIKVTTIEQLDTLIEQGNHDFVIASGILRSSKFIEKDGDNLYFVLHLIDDTEEQLTTEELMADNIGSAMRNGTFYCETD